VQVALRVAHGVRRHAGELRHLHAEAAARRAVGDLVHEHDAVAVLDRVEVHVRAARQLRRQRVSSK
jgi:hypothetical protein